MPRLTGHPIRLEACPSGSRPSLVDALLLEVYAGTSTSYSLEA